MGVGRGIVWSILLTASLSVSGSSIADRPEDTMTSARVKVALLNADGVDGFAIAVETVDGVVTLEGVVHSEAEKALAEETASGVVGVRGVTNRVQVDPKPGATRGPGASSRSAS